MLRVLTRILAEGQAQLAPPSKSGDGDPEAQALAGLSDYSSTSLISRISRPLVAALSGAMSR